MLRRMLPTKRPRGRPPAEDPKRVRLVIKVTPDEHAELHAAAARDGQTLSEWARALLFKRARKVPPKR